MRLFARRRRGALAPAFMRQAGASVQERLVALDAFGAARTVGVYMAMAAEVGCEIIIEACRGQQKSLCIPAWRGGSDGYAMAIFREGTEMVDGPMGIAQPRNPQWVAPNELDLVVVPGVGFDRSGGRLGHGAGHYDRMLSQVGVDCLKVGLCFECQILDDIPQVETDVKMDLVVTEQGVWKSLGQEGRP